MKDSRIIRRYTAYYRGWCLAFGEHTADYEESRPVNWLYGEDRVGLILSPGLRKQAQRELLGRMERIPEFTLSDRKVQINQVIYRVNDEPELENIQRLKRFLLGSPEMHMFLCSHLFYPRLRIITFDRHRPLAIMYKEMQSLKLILD